MSAARDVQLSAFPDYAPDKPVGAIVGSVFTGTNADLMAAIAPLYLAGSVLDVTYGEGKWWDRFTPDPFTFHDLHKVDGVDFRNLPEPDNSVDATCFDPPYVPAGGTRTTGATDDEAKFRSAYGLERINRAGLLQLVRGGLAECCRVSSTWVLAKCTDYVDGARFHLGHLDMIEAAAPLGWQPHDLIVHNTGSGPGGHNIFTPLRARRNHSYLLVFEKSRR